MYNVDLATDTLAADNGALAINCSWGADDNTGSDYISVLADTYVWDNQQIYVVAAGNSGTAAGSINSPASAKNVIAVGSVNNGTLALEFDSSEGPTRDGRQKPDIYAPGRWVTSADASNLNGSVDMGGTSMATAHVTGFLATLLGHYTDFQRRPALAKAYIMATAQRKSWLSQRIGVLNSYNAHWSTTNAHAYWSWHDDPRPYSYVYFDLDGVPSGVAEMHVVLTWIEPECLVGDYYTVYNDVDLYVDHGKNDGELGEWSSTSAYDNVEYVKIINPPAGNYRIKARKYSALTDYRIGCAVWYTFSAEVPTAPSNFSHSSNSTGGITWTWNDNSNSEDGFRGYDATDHLVWTTSENTACYTEPNLSVNTQYTRYVRAFNANGDSNPSNSHAAYTSIETPSGITFGNITNSGICVRSADTPTGLNRGSSGLIICNTTEGADSGWKQDNDFWSSSSLLVNTQYGFRAKARNGDGDETDCCATAFRFTLANAPGAAPFTHITRIGIQVNWTSHANPAGTEYLCENVTRGTASGWTTKTYWNDAGLSCETQYRYLVKARNGDGVETESVDLGFQSTLPPPPIIYVDKEAVAGANDGSSWDDAFINLQDALDAALYGDEIRVGKGTYKPDPSSPADPAEATFQLVRGAILKGGYAGYGATDPDARDPNIYETILSGDLAGNDIEVTYPLDFLNDPCRMDNCYHVLNGSGADPNTILDGFTITGGNANGDWRLGHDKGGGIFACDVSVANCIFHGNSAVEGGGIFESDGPVTNCFFYGNSAAEQGGAIYWSGGPATNCTFSGNTATGGGGIFVNFGPMTNCTFRSNTAISGGGILISFGSMTCGTFSGNSAAEEGGGIYWSAAPLTNCIFSGNKAASYGGGIYRNDGPLTNCTFSGNAAAGQGGGIYWSSDTIINCILWDNLRDADGAFGGPFMDESAQIRFSEEGKIIYCCVPGGTGNLEGLGNIDEEPLFVKPGYWNRNYTLNDPNDDFWVEGDYHLQSIGWRWNAAYHRWDFDEVTSRCIDAGNPGFTLREELLSVPLDPGNIWGENLRINMGAYGGTGEASMPPHGWALRADLTNDGIVNLEDFAHQAHDWLKTDAKLPGDLNRDKTINILDLALLMQEWLREIPGRN
ncbi:MAG: hypothetical protein AMJ79_13525 [Phycisphaerae bacterium SM23_30]|nr:MAG: hypothetical protein AMJ79_13525 [Phycisphaerae bacterium SM23_30]